MSGSPRKENKVADELLAFSKSIIFADHPLEKVRENKALIDGITPSEVIGLVDELVRSGIAMDELKPGINKLLNLFHKSLIRHTPARIEQGSFLDILQRNNAAMEERLKNLRPLIRVLNRDSDDVKARSALLKGFRELETFDNHYLIKENVMFPILEEHWPDYRCLQVMWSFHDDIRINKKQIISILRKKDLDLQKFNRLAGDLFFNMLAIKFREEKILFPVMVKNIPKGILDVMLEHSREFSFPFVEPEFSAVSAMESSMDPLGGVNLDTGVLKAKQIQLIFNHLPVDITFVDEHNKVRYYSTPAKRIFPRAKSIIGRDVRNCHPPESVHIVEEIIEEFRKGNQDKASFWIKMGQVYLLIQYFAVRDSHDRYCGVVEVSQDITDIKQIKGEQRLPDWKK